MRSSARRVVADNRSASSPTRSPTPTGTQPDRHVARPTPAPAPATTHLAGRILELQRTAGNAAVTGLFVQRHGGTDAGDLLQPRDRGGKDGRDVAEFVEEPAGEGLHVLTGDDAEQEKLKKFVVGQGLSASLAEAGAEAGAVVGDVGRELARRKRDRNGLVGREKGK